MNKQITGILFVGFSFCMSANAELIDDRSEALPKGILEIQQAFIFNSLILPEETLAEYGVQREAILLKGEGRHEKIDHLPVFLDLK